MTIFTVKEQSERDDLLSALLKTPPQPRPKRERGKSSPKLKGREVLANDEKHNLSA